MGDRLPEPGALGCGLCPEADYQRLPRTGTPSHGRLRDPGPPSPDSRLRGVEEVTFPPSLADDVRMSLVSRSDVTSSSPAVGHVLLLSEMLL